MKVSTALFQERLTESDLDKCDTVSSSYNDLEQVNWSSKNTQTHKLLLRQK